MPHRKAQIAWDDVRIVRVIDIARHYQVSEGQIRKWALREEFPKPVYKVPGTRTASFYSKDEIVNFFKIYSVKKGETPFCSRIQTEIEELRHRVFLIETKLKDVNIQTA